MKDKLFFIFLEDYYYSITEKLKKITITIFLWGVAKAKESDNRLREWDETPAYDR